MFPFFNIWLVQIFRDKFRQKKKQQERTKKKKPVKWSIPLKEGEKNTRGRQAAHVGVCVETWSPGESLREPRRGHEMPWDETKKKEKKKRFSSLRPLTVTANRWHWSVYSFSFLLTRCPTPPPHPLRELEILWTTLHLCICIVKIKLKKKESSSSPSPFLLKWYKLLGSGPSVKQRGDWPRWISPLLPATGEAMDGGAGEMNPRRMFPAFLPRMPYMPRSH